MMISEHEADEVERERKGRRKAGRFHVKEALEYFENSDYRKDIEISGILKYVLKRIDE